MTLRLTNASRDPPQTQNDPGLPCCFRPRLPSIALGPLVRSPAVGLLRRRFSLPASTAPPRRRGLALPIPKAEPRNLKNRQTEGKSRLGATGFPQLLGS
jgi:hypothetical protein